MSAGMVAMPVKLFLPGCGLWDDQSDHMGDPGIDAFLAYISRRGISSRFHGLYRDELLAVVVGAGVRSVENLTGEQLRESVGQAERMLKNRKAVCAALDEFLRTVRNQSDPPLRPPSGGPRREHAMPDSLRGSSAYPDARDSEHRRYVRVPFNREVTIEGSLAPCRTSDLSLGGMYLETRHTLGTGERVEVSFKLRASDRAPLVVQAEVAYVDPGMGVGIYFVDLPNLLRREVRHYVEEVIAGRQF